MGAQLMPYEKAGRVIRLLAWLQVVAFIGIVAAVAIPFFAQHKSIDPRVFLALLFIAFPALYLAIGKAIKEHKEWGRNGGIIIGALMLVGFPIGTIIGAYLLWCLIKGWEQTGACGSAPGGFAGVS